MLAGLLMGTVLLGVGVEAAPTYVGARKCRPCHLKQFTTWEKTKMAKSFDVLKPGAKAAEKKAAGLDPAADYTADAKCLPCHTTGYQQPGGFTSLKATPDLVGVGCESCHGPGSDYIAKNKSSLQAAKEYKRADILASGLVVPNADTCMKTCHNEKSPFVKAGYVFDFEKNKKTGTHEHVALQFKH
jgi:hypothetical protein